jgi:short-subunit dehydrogenase
MSDALRMELRRWNIPVVLIEPGAIETPIWQTSQRRAARISGELAPAARDSYGGVLRAFETGSGRAPKHAISPDRVALVIERALTARRPRTRYLVGLDARLAAFAKAVLPDRLFDRLVTSRR